MNKKILGLTTIILATVTLALQMSTVYATIATPVSGTIYIETQATQIPRFAGKSGNLIIEFMGGNVVWSGSIVGEASYTGSRWVWSQNVVNTYNIYTFNEATVDEKTGGLCIIMTANTKGSPVSHWRIIGGTGELANIHGQGTFSLFSGYSGQVHFDP